MDLRKIYSRHYLDTTLETINFGANHLQDG